MRAMTMTIGKLLAVGVVLTALSLAVGLGTPPANHAGLRNDSILPIPGVAAAPAPPGAVMGLSWDDPVNTAQDGYVIERRPNVSGGVYVEVGRTAMGVLVFTDATVVDGQDVCYHVAAFRTTPAQVAPWSNEACGIATVVLVAPINLILTPPAH